MESKKTFNVIYCNDFGNFLLSTFLEEQQAKNYIAKVISNPALEIDTTWVRGFSMEKFKETDLTICEKYKVFS